MILAAVFSLSACADFGPFIVRQERVNYNEAVHDTSAEQLLLNVVRTSKYESTVFSDFVEYDSTPASTFSFAGGAANIGAAATGSLVPTVGASENTLQKTLLHTGQQLAQQISSPLSLRSIRRLSLAAEPNVPLLRFSFSRLGAIDDYFRAIALINFLDNYGAILMDSRTENTLNIVLQKGYIDEQMVPYWQTSHLIALRATMQRRT